MNQTLWSIRCVWLRYFAVFRKNLSYGLVTTFVEPLLYLVAFGYGMGALINSVEVGGVTLKYRQFIFAGVVAQTILFQAFFEAAYGSFIRMYYQRVFQSIATTPITLSEVLWGELLWDSSRATFAASAVLLIGVLTGDFSVTGALICLPLCYLSAMVFAGMGLWVSASSRTIEEISYPQYLLVFPMFLFCGVFFPLETLPKLVQTVVWILPLTSVISLVRTLLLGTPFQAQALPILLAWLIILVFLSRKSMINRLVK